MNLPIRISTAPPSFGEHGTGEGSYYCDIYEIDDWEDFAVADDISADVRSTIIARFLAGYRVMGAHDREIGILVCVADDDDGMIYYGLDHAAVHCREPAANEALWSVANAATLLPDGYRLKRVGAPRSER